MAAPEFYQGKFSGGDILSLSKRQYLRETKKLEDGALLPKREG